VVKVDPPAFRERSGDMAKTNSLGALAAAAGAALVAVGLLALMPVVEARPAGRPFLANPARSPTEATTETTTKSTRSTPPEELPSKLPTNETVRLTINLTEFNNEVRR